MTMMIISLANQKGGEGKSTTAQNINARLQLEGYKTLVIDLDPQGNLSYAMNVETPNKTAYDLLNGDNDCITHTEQGDLIASDKRRSEEHTSELQSRFDLVCRLLLEKK